MPSLLDKLLPATRPRQATPDPSSSSGGVSPKVPPVTSEKLTKTVIKVAEGGKNRAVVDSDSDDDKSDTSIESDEDEKSPPKKKKKIKKMNV